MMKPLYKGLVLAAVHLALVLSLGGKLLMDRATRPRVWALTAPVDPNLPIRGRYVRLQIHVQPRVPDEPANVVRDSLPVVLREENGQLIAVPDPNASGPYGGSGLRVRGFQRNGQQFAVLDTPLAFFIPEHVKDPSIRPQGEELWVEVTLPKKGPPRPIRLGVKKGDGPITPLELN
jgi:hypothetical protein